ncbi:hypothetical protein BPAE_0101g00050 [Botrytis paeoniae]|uniref:Uncharacterized protein n=1 Tax=Botrytis paeoniae TaxID=278948 RepID=A0A4Z1FS06_9HELO|nr:hypothetical protein BPAE_0101g00050 [Botrytis paeoniae]
MYMPIAKSKEREKERRKIRYHNRIESIYQIYATIKVETWTSRDPNTKRNKRNMPDVVLLETFAIKAMKK